MAYDRLNGMHKTYDGVAKIDSSVDMSSQGKVLSVWVLI